MTPITWRHVRAGEYTSEAGRVKRVRGGWYAFTDPPASQIWTPFRLALGAKQACEAAWRRAQEGDTP